LAETERLWWEDRKTMEKTRFVTETLDGQFFGGFTTGQRLAGAWVWENIGDDASQPKRKTKAVVMIKDGKFGIEYI